MTKRIILLQALTATPNDLERMLYGVGDTAVIRTPAPGQWSMADVLCHLLLVEEQYRARLQRLAAEERPFLPAIHPNAAAHDCTQPPAQLLQAFRRARNHTLDYLKSIKAGVWQRTAVHETLGEVKFRYLVQYLVDHDTDHLNQLVEIQQQIKALPDRDAQPATHSQHAEKS